MGNCCKTASSMDFAGDDWGSLTSKHKTSPSSSSIKVFDEGQFYNSWDDVVLEKKQLLGALLMGVNSSSDANGKVKIKISKKELQEIMGGMEKKKQKQEGIRVSAEQVLVRLLNARDHHVLHHHDRPWRPVLQSIPEIN